MMYKIVIFILIMTCANISIAQNRLSQSAKNNSARINQLQLLGIDSLTVEYNFCDSTIKACLLKITGASAISIPDLNLIYTIRRKNKSQNLLETRSVSLSNQLTFDYYSPLINLGSYGTGNYIIQALLFNKNVVLDSMTLVMQRWNDKVETNPNVSWGTPSKTQGLISNNIEAIVDIKNTFVAKYPYNTLMNNIKACYPMATAAEQNVISSLQVQSNDTLARRFFYNFWHSRNMLDPKTEWESYAKKLNYVASNFGMSGVPGYLTDRGRIYLRYGEPSRTETVNNEQGTIPYEVWQYDVIANGKEITFLFMQAGMMGSQMSLLHSTMPGEIYNPYWVNALIKDTERTDYRIYNYLPLPSTLNNR